MGHGTVALADLGGVSESNFPNTGAREDQQQYLEPQISSESPRDSGLRAWDWPANIRELENFIERAVILTRSKILEAPLPELRLPLIERSALSPQSTSQTDLVEIVKGTLHAFGHQKNAEDERTRRQREEITRALTESKGRLGGMDGAAARMGVCRTTLISRINKLGIKPDDYKPAELQLGRQQ